MAAYASLVSLEQTTNLILDHHKYSISADEREQITSIREYVIFLIPFLDNFPEKAIRLEGKIRDLAIEAEDLIEYFMWNQFQKSWSIGMSRVEFEGRLNVVREKIGSISGDLMDVRLCYLPAAISSSRVVISGKNDVVIGLDEDLIAIKERLCGSSKLEVIPIIGMGGIGKTTLARNAYNDSLIIEYFHIRAFVQVSQDYSAKEFLTKLLASIKLFEEKMLGEKKESGIAENECDESVIAENVYKRLKGRKYLIVMDDIWSTKAWDDVRNIFPDDKNGSRIMLTTRLSEVATYASTGSPLHEMKIMDENQSWDLLKLKVFTNAQDCLPELEDTAKEIARSCRGLPLAVVLVAGILSTIAKTKASWEKVANNVNSIVDGPLDSILSLSYTFLPHHLRPCFLFFAGFPQDHDIPVSRLTKLWVAEGFLKQQDNEYKSLEEEAEKYLEDLVKKSLVLVTSWKSNGKIKSCSLHDLIRDMCIRKAQEEKFLLTDRHVLPNGRKDERRINIGHSRFNQICSPTIRTLLCFTTMSHGHSPSLAFLVRFKLLRVLEVIHCRHLPPQVFDLFHLRYLASCASEIPAAISKLVNLQTLIIRSELYVWHIPSHFPLGIWRLLHLRHLVFPESYMLPDPEDESTLSLQNLQTLSVTESFVCSERILKMIPNLKKLGIIYSTNDERSDLSNLVSLQQLEKLKIVSPFSFTWQGDYPIFPRSLMKLSLVGGRLPWGVMSLVGSLPNLQVLKLKHDACVGDTWETADGEFPQLKFLLLQYLNIQQWIAESNPFPKLKCLVLHKCDLLKEIPESIGEIPTLEVIRVDGLNESLVKSAKQIQEDQLGYGNDALHVHVI